MPDATPQRKWFSPPEKAEELGCDPQKILRWIKSGALVAIDISQNVGGEKTSLANIGGKLAGILGRSLVGAAAEGGAKTEAG